MSRPTLSYDRRPAGSPPPTAPVLVMTRVPYRSPNWKAHTHLGHARLALTHHGAGELWVFEDGHWSLKESRTR